MQNKTYKQMMTERPLELYQGTTLNSDTQNLIRDWFYYRHISESDEDKWLWLFHRQLNEHYPRYLLLLADELSQMPELVDYKEHISKQIQNGSTIQDVLNTITSLSGTNSETIERDISGTDTSSDTRVVDRDTGSTDSGSDSTTHTGTSTNAQTVDASHVEMSRMLPQSTSYPGATAGSLPALDWSDASTQGQSKDSMGTQQRTDNLTDATTFGKKNVGTEDVTETNNGTYGTSVDDDTTRSGSKSSTESKTGTVTKNIDNKTGEVLNDEKTTVFVTELKTKIWYYIEHHCAWEWFKRQIEEVFMGVYE